MGINYTYESASVQEMPDWILARKAENWAFVQMCATMGHTGINLLYTLRKNDQVRNLMVNEVPIHAHIASITDHYPAAFVFENEAHDLFGVSIDGISIDFKGKFYNLAVESPMTIVSAEKLAAQEKARKLAAAKAKKDEATDKTEAKTQEEAVRE